jgi:succinate-semialdehyde dehydrogenase / glutarate-semialdehyde dehydrogenase
MSDYAVINPATGETLKTYPTITDDELDAAIAGAYKTYQEWARTTTVEERTKLVRRVGELHAERREELAAIAVREMGKPM